MINLKNISKSFDSVQVLNSIDLNINEEDKIALLGTNGAGKSTLIKIISGEIIADEGVKKTNLNFKNEVGIMPQENLLVDDLKVKELVQLKALMNSQKNFDYDKWLNKINLSEKKENFVDSLSGGQKRRLSLVLSIINNPKLLILDEPTTGMDLESVDNFWGIMKENKFTTLIVTHDFNQIDTYFNRVLILKKGKILSDNFVEDIHKQGMNIEEHYRQIIKEGSDQK